MTDPVILLGTQSNGETLPVQVNSFGQLVAEGLQGPKGEDGDQGPPGEPGKDGGSFPLPPDPYEGALLGWLNNQLSWIGTPPIPIPGGVFGPIVDWNAVDNVITLADDVPDYVGSGVYVWQVDENYQYFTKSSWDTTQVWSNGLITSGEPFDSTRGWDKAFNGKDTIDGGSVLAAYNENNVKYTLLFNTPITASDKIELLTNSDSNGDLYINGGTSPLNRSALPTFAAGGGWLTLPTQTLTQVSLTRYPNASGSSPVVAAVRVDNKLLVDSTQSLNMRVSQAWSDQILGIPNLEDEPFTPGMYLKVPEQRVAPWVLYGNDPTTHIDLLRNT